MAPVIVDYVDLETGEILPAIKAKRLGAWPEIRVSECMAVREAAINSLRPEVQQFAYFVLQFRNRRRGIHPTIETLVSWYAQLHGKRADNIRRYIPRLRYAGVLVNDSLLGEAFQIAGKNTSAKDHLCEDVRAHVVFAKLEWQVCPNHAVSESVPEWFRSVQADRRVSLLSIVDKLRPFLNKSGSALVVCPHE